MILVIILNDGSRGILFLILRNLFFMNFFMLIFFFLDYGCCGLNSEVNVDVILFFLMVIVDGFDGDDGLS